MPKLLNAPLHSADLVLEVEQIDPDMTALLLTWYWYQIGLIHCF